MLFYRACCGCGNFGVSNENGADESVVMEKKAAVNAVRFFRYFHKAAILCCDNADAEQVYAQHLQGVHARHAAECHVGACGVLSGHGALAARRFPESIDNAVPFRRIARREYVRV